MTLTMSSPKEISLSVISSTGNIDGKIYILNSTDNDIVSYII